MAIAISEEARSVLRAAGWQEGRVVDLEPIRAFLEQHGFDLFATARDCLAELHGFKARLSRRGGLSFVHFDVFEAVAQIEEGDRPYIDALAPAPLCPVGHGGGVMLFVSADGEMVLLSDSWLGYSRVPSIAEGMDIILGIRRTPHYDGVALTREQIPPGYR